MTRLNNVIVHDLNCRAFAPIRHRRTRNRNAATVASVDRAVGKHAGPYCRIAVDGQAYLAELRLRSITGNTVRTWPVSSRPLSNRMRASCPTLQLGQVNAQHVRFDFKFVTDDDAERRLRAPTAAETAPRPQPRRFSRCYRLITPLAGARSAMLLACCRGRSPAAARAASGGVAARDPPALSADPPPASGVSRAST